MKAVKIVLVVILLLAVIAGTYFWGLKSGADLVRNGLHQNYPTIKTLVMGSMVDFDSTVYANLTIQEDTALFNYLKGSTKSDTIQIAIPAYTRYGLDIGSGSVRTVNREDAVEVSMPPIKLVYCELRFDKLMVNGQAGTSLMNGKDGQQIRKELYNYFTPLLSKHKNHLKAAKNNIAKSLMFYFIPYKFNLRVYFDNDLWPLPVVPGVTQSVEDAIRQGLNK